MFWGNDSGCHGVKGYFKVGEDEYICGGLSEKF